MENEIKIDLHVHSRYSEDAKGDPKEIIKILKKRGINGVAITDHNTVKGSLKALDINVKDFLVIPGIEISTLDGHLLAIGVNNDIPRDMSIEETVEMIIDEGGVPVIPHLYRPMSGVKKKGLMRVIDRIGSIEVFNSCSLLRTNRRIETLAKSLGLGGTGGSDAHDPSYAGYGYTVIETNDLDMEDILSEIKKGKTWGRGKTLPVNIRKDRVLLSIRQFFGRGFRRI